MWNDLSYAVYVPNKEIALTVEKALINSGAKWVCVPDSHSTTEPVNFFERMDKECSFMLFIQKGIITFFPGPDRFDVDYMKKHFGDRCDVFETVIDTNVRQVCLWRKDLKVRTGKKMAQAGHAFERTWISGADVVPFSEKWFYLYGNTTKIVLEVDDLDHLLYISNQLNESSIEHCIVTDLGLTEFNGIETITCIGIAPTFAKKLIPITAKLSLA